MSNLRAVAAAFLFAGVIGAAPTGNEATPAASEWSVVSYNIRHGRGTDGRVDLERTADVLRRLDPDVVALQEVDEGVERSGGVDQAARLGQLLGMQHAFGSFFDYQGGRYGMAILSHCPLRAVRSVRLPDGHEPRVALVVELELPDGGAVTVVDVHFDWVEDDAFRFAQAREVARLLDEVAGPVILAGDFNDEPGSRTLELFHARATEAAKPRARRFTFDAIEPRREIDFIFTSPAAAWRTIAVQVVDEPIASDHRPVVARLELLSDRGEKESRCRT
jgi:endonuclease/exonuclease/phosphatase family metal-dependent hydrolase